MAAGQQLRRRPAPRPAAAGQDLLPWLILGALGLAAGAGALLWLAGALAQLAAGRGWHPVPFGAALYRQLLHGRLHPLFPAVSTRAVWLTAALLTALLLAVLSVAGLAIARRWPRAGDPIRALAGPAELHRLTPPAIRAAALQLRPSLAALSRGQQRGLPGEQCGPPLGVLAGPAGRRGPLLRGSWEDVQLAIMAPRAGKTTAIAIPGVLAAPGPAIATSNKADLYLATAAARAAGGQLWVFDPQQVAFAPRDWWWNPLATIEGVEDAHRLAQHFLTAKAEQDFWDKAAAELLTALLLAAALTGGSLLDVYRWLADSAAPEPVDALNGAGHPAAAAALRGMQSGALETREGVYQTARTAAQALRDPAITGWVTAPPDGSNVREFSPAGFVTGHDTLYLLSKDGAGSAAPLVAALTDAVFRAGVGAAERAGGRLDPPLVAVLDEAANICRIKDLPDLYSHLGSRGIVPVTILQSYKQGVRVWGEPGMDTLWSAATIKLIGAGIDDPRTAEDLSRLIGEHDVPTHSASRGPGGASQSTSLRRERIFGPDQIRALPKGTALLYATGTRVALLTLQPWYAGPQAAALQTAQQQASDQLRDRARAAAPADGVPA